MTKSQLGFRCNTTIFIIYVLHSLKVSAYAAFCILFAPFLHPFPWYTFSINNRQELVGGKVNEMKKRIAAIVLCALLVVCVFPTATFAAQNNEDIIILYENDVHCAVEGYSRLSAMKKELQERYAFVGVVSGGD